MCRVKVPFTYKEHKRLVLQYDETVYYRHLRPRVPAECDVRDRCSTIMKCCFIYFFEMVRKRKLAAPKHQCLRSGEALLAVTLARRAFERKVTTISELESLAQANLHTKNKLRF